MTGMSTARDGLLDEAEVARRRPGQRGFGYGGEVALRLPVGVLERLGELELAQLLGDDLLLVEGGQHHRPHAGVGEGFHPVHGARRG